MCVVYDIIAQNINITYSTVFEYYNTTNSTVFARMQNLVTASV